MTKQSIEALEKAKAKTTKALEALRLAHQKYNACYEKEMKLLSVMATPKAPKKEEAPKTDFVFLGVNVETTGVVFKDRKSTRLNSSHSWRSRMPSSA